MKKFQQLVRMEISNDKFLVVSKTIDGKISIAQQLRVYDDNGKEMYVFLKNAILFDIETFEKFRARLAEVSLDQSEDA